MFQSKCIQFLKIGYILIETMNTAIKHQKVISDNIKRAQQEELNEYFFKIKRMGELKKENERLKVHEKQEKTLNK